MREDEERLPWVVGVWWNQPALGVDVPGGSDNKESACDSGDLGSIPGSGRSPGVGNGNLLQYSCLENFIDRGAWQATVPGVTKNQRLLNT